MTRWKPEMVKGEQYVCLQFNELVSKGSIRYLWHKHNCDCQELE